MNKNYVHFFLEKSFSKKTYFLWVGSMFAFELDNRDIVTSYPITERTIG